MTRSIYSQIYAKFVRTGIFLAAVLLAGTVGYWFIGGRHYSLVDCLYMTFITITTIGYGEIIDMSGNPTGRIFTMFIAISGISIATYILSNLTAFTVEGELSKAFRRRKMEKTIKKLRDHYIVCGVDSVGFYILSELAGTKRPNVMVDIDRGAIERVLETFPEGIFIEGDATDSDTLLAAGITDAKGLFAVTGDDNQNLVISLTAKQLNPNVRVVASCKDLKNTDKLKKAGADAVVSPTSIGGLRMASEMVRSKVVSFLDTMLRDKETNLRIEEIVVPATFVGKKISELGLGKYPHILLLAIRTEEGWLYNPPGSYTVELDDTLIFMTTPEERTELEKIFEG
jgi:voltage-gated potassium channel